MLTLDLYKKLNEYLPESLRCEWDNDGIMVLPSAFHETKKVLLCLDITSDVLERAKSGGYDCVISHHPLIFSKLKSVGCGSFASVAAAEFLKSDIAVLSFHTRLDAASGGINDALAYILGVEDTRVLEYDGERICRIGELDAAVDFDDFLRFVQRTVGALGVSYVKNTDKVKTVAVTGGSYDEGVDLSCQNGADVYVVGEVKYHTMLHADEMGYSVICIGHYFSEKHAGDCIKNMLSDCDVTIDKYDGACPIKYTEGRYAL